MNIERDGEIGPKIILGSDLKKGKVYISASDVDQPIPTLYHAVSYGIDKLYVCSLVSGAVYSGGSSDKYLEVEAKVVWSFFK